MGFFLLLVQAVPSSPSSSPVTPRGTSSFKSLVGRVRGVGLGGLDPAEMQSPNKTKYSRSESRGAGLRIGDHPVGEHVYTLFRLHPVSSVLDTFKFSYPGQVWGLSDISHMLVWRIKQAKVVRLQHGV